MSNDFDFDLNEYAEEAQQLQGLLGGGGVSLPDEVATLFWSNPDRKMPKGSVLYTGGLCIPAERFDAMLAAGVSHPGSTFVPHTRITSTEKEVEEYGTKTIYMAPIMKRDFWVEYAEDGGYDKVYREYAPGRRSQTYLFGLFGIKTDSGIVPWTFGTIKVSGLQSKTLNAALREASKATKDARVAMGKKNNFEIPLSWFYFEIGCLTGATQTVGTGSNTKKIGVIEINPDVDTLTKRFIGVDTISTLKPFADDMVAWAEYRLSFTEKEGTQKTSSDEFDFNDPEEDEHPF